MTNAFLIGEKLYLRPLEESDADSDYPTWLNNPDTCAGNSHHVFPNTKKKTLEYISSVTNSNDCLILAIIAKTNDRHIGNVSLQNINLINRSAEFAIIIAGKNVWGRGYGAEAGRLIINHGFSSLNLHRIYCGTFENNVGMKKMAEKMCMKEVGRLRQAAYKNGKYLDVIQYDLLKEEF